MKFSNEGSKERFLALNFPGRASAVQALDELKKRRARELNGSASQSPRDADSNEARYTAMINSILLITEASKGIDFSRLNEKIQSQLAQMKLETVNDILRWRMSWLKVLGEYVEETKVQSDPY